MAYEDLREWIDTLEKEGELAKVKTKVDWDLEIGGIVQEVFDKGGPALLFENIKDHENTLCRKFFTGSLQNYSRIALMMGLPKNTPPKEIIKTYMERLEKPIEPVRVKTGAVKKNIISGDKVDLFQFPAPKWRARDGGRYIGTCDGVVTKDPGDRVGEYWPLQKDDSQQEPNWHHHHPGPAQLDALEGIP